ncbi:MAG: DinB family protein [Armatimonadetes bacterium]|nr:DinB family protein [Armatimonadota bacterium]
MDAGEWLQVQANLVELGQSIEKWTHTEPDPLALRCEYSRHRTLAHLRACQEQWLVVLRAFAERDNPCVTVLHPWRHFEAMGYAALPWDVHMAAYLEGRQEWIRLCRQTDPNRGGKWNRKPDSVGGLVWRLVSHEHHHISSLRNA